MNNAKMVLYQSPPAGKELFLYKSTTFFKMFYDI
jgi:hypothetical protein